jgi:hypothetical protein
MKSEQAVLHNPCLEEEEEEDNFVNRVFELIIIFIITRFSAVPFITAQNKDDRNGSPVYKSGHF